ncbi:HAD family hydrolase [Microbacterium sp. DT81.1]|uniref:HAD family hydrolase n=1 Tax=Microbacterium sp. DT81.1 TaxID=3393413 RepID=UPI003CEF38BB
MPKLLPSWRDTATRRAIIDFVESVSGDGADAVPIAERIAVFDNDGTLWTEKPMPTQLAYIVEKWAAHAQHDPSLAERQPYRAVAAGDLGWLGAALDKHYAGDDEDLRTMIGALVSLTDGVSVEDYESEVAAFYRDATHHVLRRPYADVVYQPMLELLRYLEQHGFTCYIVSGGDRDFMRPMTEAAYGIPPERVIGSALGLAYDAEGNVVRYGASFSFMDDGPEKPVRIWSRIGRRPLFAGGNSNGDIPMLRFAHSPDRPGFSLLIHHDDDTGRGDDPYDEGAEQALALASAGPITRVSVKHDWSTVFPPEPAS